MEGALNLPGVNVKVLCWKCEAAMVKQGDNTWKCPVDGTLAAADGTPLLVKK